MIKVSVIIPAYNAQDFLAQALESVLAQTFHDFEIIVVDDGSTDNTKVVAEKYVLADKERVKYIYQANKGPAAARNAAIRASKGEFLALLDADDIWLPDRLADGVLAFKKNPDAGLVHSDTMRINEKGGILPKPKRDVRLSSGRIFSSLMLRKIHISSPTVLIPRSVIDRVGFFDENPICRGVEDRELWLRITREFKAVFINKVLAHYRVRANSISRDPDRMATSKIYVLNKFIPEDRFSFLRLRAVLQICRESADDLLIKGKYSLAKKYYWQAILSWPFSFWCWVNFFRIWLQDDKGILKDKE